MGIPQPPFDKIPPRVDWISVNPHAAGDDRKGEDAHKRIFWPTEDHKLIEGEIIKPRKESADAPEPKPDLKGRFKIGGETKAAEDLSRDDKKAILDDFNMERQNLDKLYSQSPTEVRTCAVSVPRE